MTDTTTTAKEQASAGEAQDMATVEETATAEMTAIDAQFQSPIFSKLPPELRNQLYKLVMAPFEDMTRCFDQASVYWRPESQVPICIDLRFMATCKRVCQESRFARTLALQRCDFYLRPPQLVAFLSTNDPVPSHAIPSYAMDSCLPRIPDDQKVHIKSVFIHDVALLYRPSTCDFTIAVHNLQLGTIQPRHLTLIRAKVDFNQPTLRAFINITRNASVTDKNLPAALPSSLDTVTILFDMGWSFDKDYWRKTIGKWEPVLLDGTKLKLSEIRPEKPWSRAIRDDQDGEGSQTSASQARSLRVEYTTARMVWKR